MGMYHVLQASSLEGEKELLDDKTTFLLLRLVNTPLVTAASKGIGQICLKSGHEFRCGQASMANDGGRKTPRASIPFDQSSRFEGGEEGGFGRIKRDRYTHLHTVHAVTVHSYMLSRERGHRVPPKGNQKDGTIGVTRFLVKRFAMLGGSWPMGRQGQRQVPVFSDWEVLNSEF